MLEIDYTWRLTSSGASTLVVQGSGYEVEQMYIVQGDGVSSVTVSIQSAGASTGPWFTEASTAVTSNTASVLRLTGPVMFVRPSINTTAATIRLVATSGA